VVQDANYNVTAIFDNAGNIVERYVYDPFGSVTVLDAGWVERSAGSQFAWQYLHQGGRFDATSGLYHFRHRDYSPTLGRWTSLDPLRYDAGDVNLYRFVGNTPTVFTDPSGLDKFWLTDGNLLGPLYLINPFGQNVWSDAWSLIFPKRSSENLKSPLHQNFDPNQTNRPGLKAGDIIDRDTRDWHNQAVQGLKSTLAESGLQAGMAAVVIRPIWGDPNKVRHIFNAKHGLVGRIGASQVEVMANVDAAVKAAAAAGKIPTAGKFEILATINGYTVKITGAVVNGEVRYGSIWIP
jgi:RHS repeat-associated protein